MPGGSARGFRALFWKKKKERGRWQVSLRSMPEVYASDNPFGLSAFAAAAVWEWAYLSSDLARFHGEWHQREAEMWTSTTSPNLRNSVFMWLSPWLASDPVIRIESGEEEGGKQDKFLYSLLHSRNSLKFPKWAFQGQPHPPAFWSLPSSHFPFLDARCVHTVRRANSSLSVCGPVAFVALGQNLISPYVKGDSTEILSCKPLSGYDFKNREWSKGNTHAGSFYKTVHFICTALLTLVVVKQLHRNLRRCTMVNKPEVKKKLPGKEMRGTKRETELILFVLGFFAYYNIQSMNVLCIGFIIAESKAITAKERIKKKIL